MATRSRTSSVLSPPPPLPVWGRVGDVAWVAVGWAVSGMLVASGAVVAVASTPVVAVARAVGLVPAVTVPVMTEVPTAVAVPVSTDVPVAPGLAVPATVTVAATVLVPVTAGLGVTVSVPVAWAAGALTLPALTIEGATMKARARVVPTMSARTNPADLLFSLLRVLNISSSC